MTLHGWIVYNGQLQDRKFKALAESIQKAAVKQGSETTVLANNEVHAFLANNSIQLIQKEKRDLPDYVVFTDKDIYLAKQLELLGIRLFNRTKAIAISDDKISTYQSLVKHNLPVPDTLIAPKTFYKTNEIDHYSLHVAIEKFGFPMIIKEAFGSFGQQVYLVHNEHELIQKVKNIQDTAYMFQAFISSSYGTDLRLHVVGDQVVAAMKRTATDDFRANVSAGGTMEAYEPSSMEKEIAIAATKAIHADFAGVDLLIGRDHPIICEVNSNAHIQNMFECTKINVADYMISHILEVLSGGN